MPHKPQRKPRWTSKVEEGNLAAAESYLSLLYSAAKAARLAARFRGAKITRFRAKDIFRASGLSLLGVSNSHVEKDQRKIKVGTALSPLLLVRDESHGKIVVADGYHRLCAVYTVDEDAWVPCRIV
jgi:hypothetical protein